MKLIKIICKDDNSKEAYVKLGELCLKNEVRSSDATGSTDIEFISGPYLESKALVEPRVLGYSFKPTRNLDEAIKWTENRLKTLKAAKVKLKELQDYAKKLGITVEGK